MALISQDTINYIVAGCLFFFLSTVAVILRVWATKRRGRSFELHDYLVFLSLLCLLGYVVGNAVAFALGYSSPMTVMITLPLEQIKTSLKIFWSTQLFSAVAVTSFRLAIILLYMEIFKTHKFHWLAKATGLVVILYGIGAVLMTCLLCQPIAFTWDPTIDGKCGDIRASVYFSAAFNMFIDIWVVFLPLPIIWNLQMTRQRKWGITASFAVGLITAGSNLGRLIDITVCNKTSALPLCALDTSILLTAEMAGGIVASCVPTLGTLFFRRNDTRASDQEHPNTPATIGSSPVRLKHSADTTLNDSIFSKDEHYDFERARTESFSCKEGSTTMQIASS